MGRQTRSRLGSLVAGAAVMILGLTVLPDSGAADTRPGQGPTTALLGTATAQGMRITYTVPDFLVVTEVMDGGGPVAQAVLETGGQSTAFAALPYPGENGVGGPALVLGLLGQSPPASYPFYVRADSTVNPSTELKDPSGSYTLRAAAEVRKSVGTADVAFGPPDHPASSATAHTEVLSAADGTMTVTAESRFSGLALGEGLLRIASVESRSVSVYGPADAEPRTTTALLIDGARIGDQAVTIGPDGVHAAGVPSPVPTGGPGPLNQALAQAGLTVRTVSAGPVEGGATADALEISRDQGPPVPGMPRSTLSLRIGGATTAVSAGSTSALVGTPELAADTPEAQGNADRSPAPSGADPVVAAPPPNTAKDNEPATTGARPAAPSPRSAAGPTNDFGTEFSDSSTGLGLTPPPTAQVSASPSPAPSLPRPSRPASSSRALAPEARALYVLLGLAAVGTIGLSLVSRTRTAPS